MSRRRVVLGVCAIGVGTLLLSGCNARFRGGSSFSDDTGVQQKVSSVRIENGSGFVHVRVGARPNVHRTVFFASDKPGPTSHFEGETLVLEDCKVHNCSIDYDVVLPVGAKVAGEVGSGDVELVGMSEVGVRAGSGDVVVRDVSGPVTLKLSSGKAELSGLAQSAVVEASSGDVNLTDIRGDVTVLSRSGTVTGTSLGGKTSVEASSGDVRLDMASVQNVKATASSGNVKITVPRGDPYKVSAKTSSGDETCNIVNDPSAGHTMDVVAHSGDIRVDYR
jgi:hypothetical protein